MNIALVQPPYPPRHGLTCDEALDWIERTLRDLPLGLDLIILPEYANMPTGDAAEICARVSGPEDGRRIARFRALAQAKGAALPSTSSRTVGTFGPMSPACTTGAARWPRLTTRCIQPAWSGGR